MKRTYIATKRWYYAFISTHFPRMITPVFSLLDVILYDRTRSKKWVTEFLCHILKFYLVGLTGSINYLEKNCVWCSASPTFSSPIYSKAITSYAGSNTMYKRSRISTLKFSIPFNGRIVKNLRSEWKRLTERRSLKFQFTLN